MQDRQETGLGEVIFEFVQVARQMRVVAVHVESATEVVIVAPLNASRHQMQHTALAKLRRRLARDGLI